MFAGGAATGRHSTSNNVRTMQLFHELKQKFPTVPDHVVSNCIAAHNANPGATTSLSDLVLLHQQQQQNQERSSPPPSSADNNNGDLMGGRSTITAAPPELPNPAPCAATNTAYASDNDDNDNLLYSDKEQLNSQVVVDRSAVSDTTIQSESKQLHEKMPYYSKDSDLVALPQTQCDNNGDESKPGTPTRRFAKRPNNLAVKSIHHGGAISKRTGHKIQPSERHNDLHTLLNSNDAATTHRKPPRSPVAANKLSTPPIIAPKPRPQTVETQTTNTLLAPNVTPSPTSNVNLSLNVVLSPEIPPTPPPKPPVRHTTNLHVVPEPVWMQPQSAQSARSYTSVNLTLRPPAAEPQAPIDITSQNSTLTYSTSSFDRARGLQSRLEISVGPGGQSTVSSVRRRPKSSYHPVLNGLVEDGVGTSAASTNSGGVTVPGLGGIAAGGAAGGGMIAAGSLPNLASDDKATTVILEQQVRINRLRIELRTEKTRLVAMQREVADLETIDALHSVAAPTQTVATQPATATLAANAITRTEAPPPANNMAKTDIEVERQLHREIRHLRGQCEQLAQAVDQRSESGVPLGETSQEFYQNIYTGQQGSISVTSSATADYTARRIASVTNQQGGGRPSPTYPVPGTPPSPIPTPGTPGRPPQHQHPPLPYPFHRPQQPNNIHLAQDETEEQSCWNCSVCTFQNHPLLNKCEQCEMLRGNSPHPPPRSPSATVAPPPPSRIPARANHSLTPPRSWLASNNPNSSGAVTPGGSSSGGSSASTPGSGSNKGYPVQQYQVLPPGYVPNVYGPPTPLPWIYPPAGMPVNTNPAVYNAQNSAYYVANSDSYGRRSSEGSGVLRPAPPPPAAVPGAGPPVPPARTTHHSRSLSQPDSRNAPANRGGYR